MERFNVSPKLTGSGLPPERAMRADALAAVRDSGRAVFKFVVAHPAELDEVASVIDAHRPTSGVDHASRYDARGGVGLRTRPRRLRPRAGLAPHDAASGSALGRRAGTLTLRTRAIPSLADPLGPAGRGVTEKC
jgi:hypothetical protein